MPGPSSIGDQSRAFALRSSVSRTKQLLSVLTREITTGRKDDLPRALGGDTRRLAGVEHRLSLLGSYQRNCTEVEGRFDAAQLALGGLGDIAAGLGGPLLATTMQTGAEVMNARLADIRSNFDAAIGLMNTQFAGEYLFAGAKTATRPVAAPEDILAALRTAVTGLTAIDTVIAAVDDFFDAPAGGGGFIDLAYAGSATGAGAVAVSPDRSVASDLTAASAAFRDTLKGLALASLVAEGAIAADPADRLTAVQAAGHRIVAAGDGVTFARARLGVQQEAVEQARTRNGSEAAALSIARNDMVRADEYETAAALAETQTQLETLYAVTARLSRLSLANRL